MSSGQRAIEHQTGQLFGDLWHRYDDELFKQSVDLFGARWRANGEPADFFQGKRCLDAGCGGGRFTFAMALMGASSVVGVDVSAEGIADANRRRHAMGADQVSFQQSSLLDLPFGNGEFDFVCCSGVLHHTVSIERGLSEIHRVLKPGGRVYLLLYGAGGLYWPVTLVLRSFAQHLGSAEVDRCIQAADLPANKRRTVLDDFFVPILETYTWERLEFLLRAAGFGNWHRWSSGQLDHEASPEAVIDELRIRAQLWNAGAATTHSRATRVLEAGLGRLCEAVIQVATSLIEQHRAGSIDAADLRTAIIGNGHHRLVAERL
jgi:ubiquinone/menaquinone biosynthesis C-methylase UbiE